MTDSRSACSGITPAIRPRSFRTNVISADYPGAVRRALRERFGEIPCVFAQGFCGDIRPNITASQRARLARAPSPNCSHHRIRSDVCDRPRPRTGCAGARAWPPACATSRRAAPSRRFAPRGLQTGSASIPLGDFFDRLHARQAAGGSDRQDRRGTRNRGAVGGSHAWNGSAFSIEAVPPAEAGSAFMRDISERCSAIFRPRRRFRKAAMRSRDFSRCSACPAISRPTGSAPPSPAASGARLRIWSAKAARDRTGRHRMTRLQDHR